MQWQEFGQDICSYKIYMIYVLNFCVDVDFFLSLWEASGSQAENPKAELWGGRGSPGPCCGGFRGSRLMLLGKMGLPPAPK